MSTTKTGISWTDRTWNVCTGCTKVSAGCTHCYAERMANRLVNIEATRARYEGTVKDGRWTGRVNCIESALDEPLHWRKPARVFVNSMSDLFHEDVPDEFIDRVFGTMAMCPQHTFMVLTKRPERMAAYVQEFRTLWQHSTPYLQAVGHPLQEGKKPSYHTEVWYAVGRSDNNPAPWPLPNVWLGVSVENQQAADERIPWLLKTPAAVRFLSCEPLIGPVSLRWPLWEPWKADVNNEYDGLRRLDWVIVGGESGPNARPMHPDWARSLRDQCADAGVPFHFKQMARRAPIPDDLMIREFPEASR